MNKSLSAMSDIDRICAVLRDKFFGKVTRKDYKDSFIVNEAIARFNDSAEALMTESITAADNEKNKAAKSLNLRAEAVEKLVSYGSSLSITESEVLRRILIYSVLVEKPRAENNRDINQVRKEIVEIRKQLLDTVKHVDLLLVSLNSISEKEAPHNELVR